MSLNAQGRYGEAEPLLRKALAIHRQALGEAHPDTAINYNHLALNLHGQGRSQKAQELWIQGSQVLSVARLRTSPLGLERAYFDVRGSGFLLIDSLVRTRKARESGQH